MLIQPPKNAKARLQMKCLIVIAHPLNDSLCKQLASHVEKTLTKMGHELMLEDLYANNFQPALNAEERGSYYTENYDSSGITLQVTKLQQAETLILLFPTWWFGFPAILKGWFDRVWGPGIAYQHALDFGPITPRLNNLKHVIAITTLGAPWWVDKLLMRQPVKRVLKTALLGTCAQHSKLEFLSLYDSEKLSDQTITKFKRRITKVLNRHRR